MSDVEAAVLECPQCGAPVKKGSNICTSCFSEYMVRSIGSIDGMDKAGVNKYLLAYRKSLSAGRETAELHQSMGICYLELGLFDFAAKSLEKAIGFLPEDGDAYFYAAISLFKGRRPFLSQMSTVKKAAEYLEAALQLGEEGKYYYLLSLIQKDFFERKRLNGRYDSRTLLAKAKESGVLEEEIATILRYVPVP